MRPRTPFIGLRVIRRSGGGPAAFALRPRHRRPERPETLALRLEMSCQGSGGNPFTPEPYPPPDGPNGPNGPRFRGTHMRARKGGEGRGVSSYTITPHSQAVQADISILRRRNIIKTKGYKSRAGKSRADFRAVSGGFKPFGPTGRSAQNKMKRRRARRPQYVD